MSNITPTNNHLFNNFKRVIYCYTTYYIRHPKTKQPIATVMVVKYEGMWSRVMSICSSEEKSFNASKSLDVCIRRFLHAIKHGKEDSDYSFTSENENVRIVYDLCRKWNLPCFKFTMDEELTDYEERRLNEVGFKVPDNYLDEDQYLRTRGIGLLMC